MPITRMEMWVRVYKFRTKEFMWGYKVSKVLRRERNV